MAEQAAKFGGRKDDAGAGESLYRYFLTARDEAALIQRLSGEER
jgi:hypothetical protein